MYRLWRFIAVLLVSGLVAACTTSPSITSNQRPGVDANVAAAANPGSLVIYSGRSESLVAPIIQQFADTTGIQVEVRYGSTAEMAATLLEEGRRSPADVFFAQDPGGLGAIANAGMLATLPGEILELVDPRFRSSDSTWVGVSGRLRVVTYNTNHLSPADLPADLQGFTDPRWHGRIGWAPTNGSFQTMVTAMRQNWGDEATRAWLAGILANQPVAYPNNTAIVSAVGAGEVEVGFVNHYYLFRFLKESGEAFPARNHVLAAGGPGSLLMVSGIGQISTGKNPDNALNFIRFLLSPVAQQYFASQTYEYPVVEGVEVDRALSPLSDQNISTYPLGDLADLQGTVELMQAVGVLP
jgi:iron(III) transport system substrate-binding protein